MGLFKKEELSEEELFSEIKRMSVIPCQLKYRHGATDLYMTKLSSLFPKKKFVQGFPYTSLMVNFATREAYLLKTVIVNGKQTLELPDEVFGIKININVLDIKNVSKTGVIKEKFIIPKEAWED